jgi:alkylhydroperoxidase family enzyme
VVAWREAPYFTEAERAALALAEAASRLSDRSDPVPDEIWNEAARHYDEPGLAALFSIAPKAAGSSFRSMR